MLSYYFTFPIQCDIGSVCDYPCDSFVLYGKLSWVLMYISELYAVISLDTKTGFRISLNTYVKWGMRYVLIVCDHFHS